MIKKIKKIKLPKCNAYFKDSNGKNHLIGVVENASEFNWLCIQAIKENTNGYFVKWKKEIINIDRFGVSYKWRYFVFLRLFLCPFFSLPKKGTKKG